jgi:uncharacterized membrane protein
MAKDGTSSEHVAPIQLLALAFPRSRFKGEILPELDRLKRRRIVRVLDLLVVRKDRDGRVIVATGSDLDWEEATALGAYFGSLAGDAADGPDGADRGALAGAAQLASGHIFDEDDIFRLTEALDNDTTAALLLIQHTWAEPLIAALLGAGGVELINEWVPSNAVLTIEPSAS